MRSSISYKSRLFRGESIQLGRNSGWLTRYILTPRDSHNKWNGTPAHQDRLDKVFRTE